MISWGPVTNILLEVLDLPPERRDSFLDRACGSDVDLRREAESLIRADEKVGDFLARPFLRPPEVSAIAELPDPESRIPPRSLVADRYRVIRFLGHGGMGEVYEAADLKLDEPVALKFMPKGVAEHPTRRTRFVNEVRMARRVSHPNVCRVHDLGETEGRLFLSMELVEGEDLATRMERFGRPNQDEALDMIRQLCRGLWAVHDQGVLHRDLKPSNLLIDGQGRLRITDFGIAGLAEQVAGLEALAGTPSHMAPEQHSGRQVDVRTDLYAMGLVVYELLAGRPAFVADSWDEYSRLHRETPPVPPSQLGIELDTDLEQMILRCLAKKPGERPSSAREVAEVLYADPRHPDGSGTPEMRPLHQLPPPPADFTGREAELDQLFQAVERGVTILGVQGMGGTGKTALALRLAERLARRYPDAQFYLDLKGAGPEPLTPVQAMAHVLRAFHPQAELPASEAAMASAFRSVLHGRHALLLMDNAAKPEQVEALVPPRGSLLLVTSRRSFALPGMVGQRLRPLPATDAVALLHRAAPGIGEEAGRIARSCGYLPIALRLAAGTLAERFDLSPLEYARRLAGRRERLELVEASFALSYKLLDPEGRKLWCALTVFPGSFDQQAATAVWDLDAELSENHLGELVKNGLVEWADGRYRLHDLARLFGEHRLQAADRFAYERRHSEHYLKVLAEVESLFLQGGESLRSGLSLFDLEWSNVEAGQAWAQTHAEQQPAIGRVCSDYPLAGSYCLWVRLPMRTRICWQTSALAAARRLNDRMAQGHHLARLGCAFSPSNKSELAIGLCNEALNIARECRDQWTEGLALGYLGAAYGVLGDFPSQIKWCRQAVVVVRELGDRHSECRNLCSLGGALTQLGELHEGIRFLEQAYLVSCEIGYRIGEWGSLFNMALAYGHLGNAARAIEIYERALSISRELGARLLEGRCLDNLASLTADLDEPRRTLGLASAARSIGYEMGDRRLEAGSACNLGRAYICLGESRRGIELIEQSLAISREIGESYLESHASWYLGLHYEQAGELDRAVALMQVRVSYERSIGHSESELHAAQVESIRVHIPGRGEPVEIPPENLYHPKTN